MLSTIIESILRGKNIRSSIMMEDLDVKELGILGDTFFVEVNGRKYGYTAPENMTLVDVEKQFKKLMTYSKGKALAWLKKNSKLVSGSVKGVSPLVRGTSMESSEWKTLKQDLVGQINRDGIYGDELVTLKSGSKIKHIHGYRVCGGHCLVDDQDGNRYMIRSKDIVEESYIESGWFVVEDGIAADGPYESKRLALDAQFKFYPEAEVKFGSIDENGNFEVDPINNGD